MRWLRFGLVALLMVTFLLGVPLVRESEGASPRIGSLPGIGRVSDIAVGDHCIFVASSKDATQPLLVVDRVTMQITETLASTPSPDVLASGSDLWVLDTSGSQVRRLVFNSSCVAEAATEYPTDPVVFVSSLAKIEDLLWLRGAILDNGSYATVIAKLDPTTGVITSYSLSATTLLGSPADPDSLWSGSGTLRRFDVSTDPPTLARQFGPASNTPIDLSSDAAILYQFPGCTGNEIKRYDAQTLLPLTGCLTAAPGWFRGFAADPTRDHVAAVMLQDEIGLVLFLWSGADASLILREPLEMTGDAEMDSVRLSPDGANIYFVRRVTGGARSLVELPGDLRPTGLSIRAPELIRYGRTITVRVHLGAYADATNTVVRLYARPAGSTKRLVATGPVDGNGNFIHTLRAVRNVTFTATYSGDALHLANTATAFTGVRPIIRGRLFGFYAREGRWAVYRAGTSPIFAVGVVPNHANKPVGIDLHRMVNGGWHHVTTQFFRLGRNSVVAVVIPEPPRGRRFRILATFQDNDHMLVSTKWFYFLVR